MLMMHGFSQTSEAFLEPGTNMAGDKRPLALQALEAGWDVWLGNNRGTRFSIHHDAHVDDDKEYWDFDWADMGAKDQPAFIETILGHA